MVKCPKCNSDMLHNRSYPEIYSTTIQHVHIRLSEWYRCPVCGTELTMRYETDVKIE
jgi:uncharacterized protein with PIN domain